MTAASRRRKHDLAAPASRFIGRADDLAALGRLFAEGRRLVTVWGPAGMGKTRLALEVARAVAEAHPDEPVRFCEVDAARDLRAFCGAVARALGVTVTAGKKDAGTVDRIGRALTAQGPMLVVLDNLEQVVEAAAPAIGAWVRAAPEARFLVTSRERTRLAGEISYELRPLGLPEVEGATSEAVELFLDRAGAVSSARPLGAESLPKIATLVRRLEGIPLAIELAAARAELLGLDGLLARLERRLDLLGGAHRGVLARQATLRDAVVWSWDLLDEADRRALARCAVFRGGFSLEAADAVLAEPALERVQSLRDKSLLRAVSREPGTPARFSLYEAVRELAEEKLAERGETAIAEARHAAHHLAIGEAAAEDWARTGSVEALDRIGDDLENLLVVVERALARPAVAEALRALLVIDPVLSTRGPFGIHLELLDRALGLAAEARAAMDGARAPDPLLEARALAARGRARQLRGSDAAGLDDLGQARARAAALGAKTVEALIATEIGVIHHRRREMDYARACYEEALALLHEGGDRRAEGRVLGNLGALYHDDRRFDEAMLRYQPAIASAVLVGDLRMEGLFSMNVGLLEQERGDAAEARRRYERAVAVLEEVGDLRLLGIALGNLGLLCHEEGRLDEARGDHARAAVLLREGGDRRSEARAEGRLGAVLASLDRIDDARAALGRGERLVAHLDDPLDAELLAVARGFLDLALARSARVAGRPAEATAYLDEARRRIARARDGAPSLADRQDDIRLFLRILERGLAAMEGESGAGAEDLLLAPEARFIRPPGGDWQDLRERHAVRRILLRLVARRRDAPGRGVSLLDLQEAGWPGERMLPQAASNRIYVAMNQLRKLGLKDCLRHGGEGYFLDPSLPVHHTAVEPLLRDK
ncbi:Signal transduction response regulator [Minicystis rosea]|nr:Signal transduction response regulator [Minicystis rosea]